MKIRKFNESVRDKMSPISGDKIAKAVEKLEKLTPYGMLNRIDNIENDYDGKYAGLAKMMKTSNLRKKAERRINESLTELDEVFKTNEKNEDLKKLIPQVKSWVSKYGGNEDNIDDYGYSKMAEKIWYCGVQWQHDVEIIYDDTVFDSFRELLKNVAICEAMYNNRDNERY